MADTTQTPPDTDRLLPFTHARSVVGLSRSKIYELLAEKQFPAPVKIGSRCYFSERELLEWIAEKLAERDQEHVR